MDRQYSIADRFFQTARLRFFAVPCNPHLIALVHALVSARAAALERAHDDLNVIELVLVRCGNRARRNHLYFRFPSDDYDPRVQYLALAPASSLPLLLGSLAAIQAT